MSVILYDANGKEIPGAELALARSRTSANIGFRGAGRGRRAAGWYPTATSINDIIASDTGTLLPRVRDAFRNNPWAVSASDHFVSATVGTGIKPACEVQSKDLCDRIEDEFERFSDHADADGVMDYYGLQELAMRGAYEGGDSFCRIRNRRLTDGLEIPLQYQMLDAEMCDHSKNEVNGAGVIKSGIQFDRRSRRTHYWMFPFHPGDHVAINNMLGNVAKRVRANQIMHVFHPRQAGQVRGIPGIASVLTILKDLEDTSDAFVLRMKIQNMFATFEQVPVDDSILDVPGEAGEEGDWLDADDTPIRALEPGTHIVGLPGHTFTHSSPPTDAGNLEDFLRATLRSVAMGAGITYEQLTGDLRETSFSSIRAGLIEFRRMMEARMMRMIIFQFCKPSYRLFLETAILSGRLKIPESDMLRAMHPTWYGTPGFEYVDPDKEVKADVRAVRAGFTTRKAIISKGGRRMDKVQEELEVEHATDLILDTLPGAIAELEDDQANSGNAGEA